MKKLILLIPLFLVCSHQPELRKWILELRPYCETCINVDDDNACEGCNRKAMGYRVGEYALPERKLKMTYKGA